MKKILITGKNSYIGTEFKKWTETNNEELFLVDELDVKDSKWRTTDFSKYDVVIHLAAIVHKKNIKEQEYMKVNCDLAYEIATNAKKNGVKQFVFFSSMSVYGNIDGGIYKDTIPSPNNFYGESKWQAEKKINNLRSSDFIVTIIRPPMVYGSSSKGNYRALKKLSRYLFIFPDSVNKRSMISINNLSIFLSLVIIKEKDGLYFPQNNEYVNTYMMIKHLRKKIFKKKTIRIQFSFLKKITIPVFKKVFGNLYYCDCSDNYKEVKDKFETFYDSIR